MFDGAGTLEMLFAVLSVAGLFYGMYLMARDSGKPTWKIEQHRAARKRHRQHVWRTLTR